MRSPRRELVDDLGRNRLDDDVALPREGAEPAEPSVTTARVLDIRV